MHSIYDVGIIRRTTCEINYFRKTQNMHILLNINVVNLFIKWIVHMVLTMCIDNDDYRSWWLISNDHEHLAAGRDLSCSYNWRVNELSDYMQIRDNNIGFFSLRIFRKSQLQGEDRLLWLQNMGLRESAFWVLCETLPALKSLFSNCLSYLWGFRSQFATCSSSVYAVLHGISRTMLATGFGGSAWPCKLYKIPFPSGSGKNTEPCKWNIVI